jgi:hypothetical protein
MNEDDDIYENSYLEVKNLLTPNKRSSNLREEDWWNAQSHFFHTSSPSTSTKNYGTRPPPSYPSTKKQLIPNRKKYSFPPIQMPQPQPKIVVAPTTKINDDDDECVDEKSCRLKQPTRLSTSPLHYVGPFVDWREKNCGDNVPDGVFFCIIQVGLFYGKYSQKNTTDFPNRNVFLYQSKRTLNMYFNQNWVLWSPVFERMVIRSFRGENNDFDGSGQIDYQKMFEAYLHYKENHDMDEVVDILRATLPQRTVFNDDVFICNFFKSLVLFNMTDVDDGNEVHKRKYTPMALIEETNENLRLFWNVNIMWRHEPCFKLVSHKVI